MSDAYHRFKKNFRRVEVYVFALLLIDSNRERQSLREKKCVKHFIQKIQED